MSPDKSAVVQIFEALDLEVLWCNFSPFQSQENVLNWARWLQLPSGEAIISNVEAETHTLDFIDFFPNIFICLLQVLIQAGNAALKLMRSSTSLWSTEKMVGCGMLTYKLYQSMFVWKKKISVCIYSFTAPVLIIQHSKWNSGWLFSSLPPSSRLQATTLWTSDVHCVHIAHWFYEQLNSRVLNYDYIC